MSGIVRKARLPRKRIAGCVLAAAMTGTAGGAPPEPPSTGLSHSSTTRHCLVGDNVHAVYFSAMLQRDSHGWFQDFTNHCQTLPVPGKTFLSIDLLDRKVRAAPVALRVVEEAYPSNGEAPREKATLLDVPKQIYRTGTADTAVEITRPGHYALIATIGDGTISGNEHLRIPFSVAMPPSAPLAPRYRDLAAGLALTFFAVMSVIGYRAYRAYNPKMLPGTAPPSPRQRQRT